VNKPYNIELSTERNQPVETNIKLCQGDNNITFNINIRDFDLTGNTVRIVFSQSSGLSVENNAIVNSDKKSCTYNIIGNELQSPGKVIADLKIYDANNKRLSSACFIFYVDIDSLNDGSFPPSNYSGSLEKALAECDSATQAALDAVQKVVNIANNDAVTVEGFAWDARRGKAIRDDVNTLNESLVTKNITITATNNFTHAGLCIKKLGRCVYYYVITVGNTVPIETLVTVGTFDTAHAPISFASSLGAKDSTSQLIHVLAYSDGTIKIGNYSGASLVAGSTIFGTLIWDTN